MEMSAYKFKHATFESSNLIATFNNDNATAQLLFISEGFHGFFRNLQSDKAHCEHIPDHVFEEEDFRH